MLIHLYFFSLFTVHYAPDSLSNLFDSTMKENISMHLHFQVQALIISRKNILEQSTLIPGGDQRLFIQDNSLSCRLVLLSSTYMGNCIIVSANILPLLGLYTRYLKVTGKGVSPVRSWILPSPILFKEVTAAKNPCSLDDFLLAKSSIKRRITALWGGGFRVQLVRWTQNVSLHVDFNDCPHFEERK